MNIRIVSKADLQNAIDQAGRQYYVYVLCNRINGRESPFYVGIGQGNRIFSHEDDALGSDKESDKLDKIRSIWEQGGEVIRYIDSFHENEPWDREAELIKIWGLIKDGTGILTNVQQYNESEKIGSVELRKYANHGNCFTPQFKSMSRQLMAGPRKPKGSKSVYGKIFDVLTENPGVTGEELVGLLLHVDFSSNRSAYTQSGEVSIPWLCGYIDGGFYEKNKCIQEFQKVNVIEPTLNDLKKIAISSNKHIVKYNGMTIEIFLKKLILKPEVIEFDEVMQVIDKYYDFNPTAFTNGAVQNEAGQNNGSCKIFYFAWLNKLSDSQALNCFGQYYRDVLETSGIDDHQNIRAFMKTGMSDISFDDIALLEKL